MQTTNTSQTGTTTQPTEDATIAAMIHYGGSFVVALAQAYQLADSRNRDKIRKAFADYWNEYTHMARIHAETSTLP